MIFPGYYNNGLHCIISAVYGYAEYGIEQVVKIMETANEKTYYGEISLRKLQTNAKFTIMNV